MLTLLVLYPRRVYEYQKIPPLINRIPVKARRTHAGAGGKSSPSPQPGALSSSSSSSAGTRTKRERDAVTGLEGKRWVLREGASRGAWLRAPRCIAAVPVPTHLARC